MASSIGTGFRVFGFEVRPLAASQRAWRRASQISATWSSPACPDWKVVEASSIIPLSAVMDFIPSRVDSTGPAIFRMASNSGGLTGTKDVNSVISRAFTPESPSMPKMSFAEADSATQFRNWVIEGRTSSWIASAEVNGRKGSERCDKS